MLFPTRKFEKLRKEENFHMLQQNRSLRTLYFIQISVLEYPEIKRSLNKELKLSVQSFSPLHSLQPHGLQHARPPCPSPTPGASQNHGHQFDEGFHPSHALLCPSSPSFNLSSIRVFSNESVLASGGQTIGVSASCQSFNEPSGLISFRKLTGFISMQSKAFSRVFFNSTVQKHQFFGAQLSL